MTNGFVFLSGERQLPMPEWWIEDFLVQGSVTMFSAQPKAGKSALAAHLTHAVATGSPFFGREVEQGAVLYMAGERGPQTEDRLLTLFGDETPQNVALFVPTISDLGPLKLNDRDDCQRLVTELRRMSLAPKLIVVDTLSNFFRGDQNNEQDMGDFFDGVRWVCERFRAAGLVLHHDNKEYVDRHGRRSGGASYRGSGAALGRVDAYIKAQVAKELPDPDDPRGQRTIKVVDIELAEDNWGGSFRQTVAVRKLLESPEPYLNGGSDAEAMVDLVLETIERAGELSVKALEDTINAMNDPRMRGRKFTRMLLKAVRERVGDVITERPDPNDKRGKLLSISREDAANAA